MDGRGEKTTGRSHPSERHCALGRGWGEATEASRVQNSRKHTLSGPCKCRNELALACTGGGDGKTWDV